MTANIFRKGYGVDHLDAYDAWPMYFITNAQDSAEYLCMTWHLGGTRPIVFKKREDAEAFLRDFCGDLAAHHGTVVPVWTRKVRCSGNEPFPRSAYLVKKTGVCGPKGSPCKILFMTEKQEVAANDPQSAAL